LTSSGRAGSGPGLGVSRTLRKKQKKNLTSSGRVGSGPGPGPGRVRVRVRAGSGSWVIGHHGSSWVHAGLPAKKYILGGHVTTTPQLPPSLLPENFGEVTSSSCLSLAVSLSLAISLSLTTLSKSYNGYELPLGSIGAKSNMNSCVLNSCVL